MADNILLVEDELNFGAVLRDYLGMNGFEVSWAQDGEAGLKAFKNGSYRLCILDVMMPKRDGFSVAKEIRKSRPDQPIIFLTARSMKEDVHSGFKLGADDYITKPFDSEELLYRIQAILKRTRDQSRSTSLPEEFQFHNFHFDYSLRTLDQGNKKVRLSPKEADLLQMLCTRKNELLSRDEALQKLWGDDNYFNARSMDVFVSKLRKHFAGDPRIRIENIHGKGFRLVVE